MKLTDAAKYEILYDLKEGEYNQTQVGAIRTKTIKSGDTLEVEAFPLITIDNGAKRERDRRKSTIAQTRLNQQNAQKKICRLIEANFGENDFAVHLTVDYGVYEHGRMNRDDYIRRIDDSGLPTDEGQARKVIKNYLRKIKRRMEKVNGNGDDFKYLYVIESTEAKGDSAQPMPERYHFHAVMSCAGLGREEVEKLWTWGYANCDRLNTKHNGLQALAKYLTKQRQFSRRWARSKNLKEPIVTVSDRKISSRRAALMAKDVMQYGREILEKIYKGYKVQEEVRVRFSDFVAGAYIYARLRRAIDCTGAIGTTSRR